MRSRSVREPASDRSPVRWLLEGEALGGEGRGHRGGDRAAAPAAGGLARCSGQKGKAGGDRDGDEPGGNEVDGGTERRPPAGAGDEAGAVLPHVLQAVAGEAGDNQPERSGRRGRGDDHEHSRDGRLDGEDVSAAVGYGEADVDRGDEGKP